jgi:hypothetical protein
MVAYAIDHFLPGHVLVGLRGWDEFIVIDESGSVFAVPTVPIDLRHATTFALPEQVLLEPDARFDGKIKWYVKPLAFGGDAADETNLAWVTHEKHAELVRWWNEQYSANKTSPRN